jgi:hypothetical protein
MIAYIFVKGTTRFQELCEIKGEATMMTWIMIFGIIYTSLVVGVLLKMVIYKTPIQRIIIAPIVPLVGFLAIPIYTMKYSAKEEVSVSQIIWKFIVVCYITVKYFPGLIGIVVTTPKHQVCIDNVRYRKNSLYSNHATVNLVFYASERLFNDLNFV